MTFSKFKLTKTLLLVGLLSVLLATLASLQYRWLGQVSNGERERMQASLHAGAVRFGQDFNREISRAYLTFQMDAARVREPDSGGLAERFEQWDTKSPFPNLVSDVYLLDKGEGDIARLSRFDRGTVKFELAEWPSELAPLRSRLITSGVVAYVQEPAFMEALLRNPVEPNVPALVSPIIAAPRDLPANKHDVLIKRRERTPENVVNSLFAGYLIIKLNQDVIANQLIPALANKYFTGGSGLEYDLTVVNLKNENKPIYQSNKASNTPRLTSGDATARLMDIQPEHLDALWFGLPRKRINVNGKEPTLEQKPGGEKTVVRTVTTGQNEISSESSVTVRVFNRDQNAIAPVDKNAANGPWQMLIQHRAGSLEAAVTSARRRNLAVSFGILLLLAGSVAMIVVSTRRAERLANKQMEFVSSVSHEFRTPLSVICSAGENLADGVIESSQQTKKYGELIRNEGRRLTEMVEQVLEFAGARSRHQSYQFQPVDIESVINDALSSYQPVIEERGYVIDQMIDADLPQVLADGSAIRRSLQNLLSNAMKYESEKRWIGIRAKHAATEEGEEVQVIVEDHGMGIAPDEVSHVFEPFYRGRDVVAAQIHGNGLGLSLVKQVIEAHHGRVSVVSEPGHGSAFTLHLPVLDQTASVNGGNRTGNV